MNGMVKLTMTAECAGMRIGASRVRSLDELQTMVDAGIGYRADCETLADQLRPHFDLLVRVPRGTDSER
jgi:hypothetical protein